ncbi:sphingosine-1-phosphate lyase 1-like [Orbicella faveolata]|uniref:sphingosine-1-phosphate lyase 1-like n=1 Tax=Orbicella faveolata TaxID=48498 RepID=UPI0009E57F30|nr:sphingosine-1-phosphate lyase 1-like [Orbicella faveolata]
MLEKTYWERFLDVVEPHLPEYLHWNEICWTFVYYLAEARRHIHRWCRGMEAWEIVVNTVTYCFYVWLVTEILRWVIGWAFFREQSLKERVKKGVFKLVRRMPYIKDKIAREMQQTMDEMGRSAFPVRPGETFHMTLPAKGMKEKELMKEIDDYLKLGDVNWQEGRVSGAIYNGGKELTEVLTKVYSKYTWANPLHVDIFPDVRKMEAEVVQMCVNMFRGGKDACGTMTTGGTESILLACKAYREWAHERRIEKPEIVAPISIHAAFDKAAHYFNLKLVHIPVDEETRRCNIKAMKRAITKNTILLCGSAPQFPHGVIDPIEDMAKLARKYNLGLHVDACLGGFLVPFMKKAGFDLPPFDFTVEGVTSISCDTHKYGFSPKGSSVIMYSNKHLRRFQFFVAPDWQGGIYACPTIPGSRPGAVIASTWAAMMYFGESGYVESTRKIIQTRMKIEAGLRKIKGIYVLGKPEVSVVAFGSKDFDIYRLADALTKRHWHLNSLQFPSSIHICVTYLNTQVGVADHFVKDVRECTAEILKDSSVKTSGMAAIYGMSQSIPDRSIVSELACGFLDCMYTIGNAPAHENGVLKN